MHQRRAQEDSRTRKSVIINIDDSDHDGRQGRVPWFMQQLMRIFLQRSKLLLILVIVIIFIHFSYPLISSTQKSQNEINNAGTSNLGEDSYHNANIPNVVPNNITYLSKNVIKEGEYFSSWIYEPKNNNYFWKKMGDRPFQREFYSRLGKFSRILDVGVRGYNRLCKDFINSTTTTYYQIEPFPPDQSEMNNDGLLDCFMQEVPQKFPSLKSSFDLVIDFGVFGWVDVQKVLADGSGIRDYVDGVRFLLKDKACWALKVDKGWIPNQDEFFEKHLLPYFSMGDFDSTLKSGHQIKSGKFQFYFFFKND